MKVRYNRMMCNNGDMVGECIFLNDEPSIVDRGGQLRRMATFECRCGNIFTSNFNNVKKSRTISCGCVRDAIARESLIIHGASVNPEISGYSSWLKIRVRCRDIKNKSYPQYGAIGITICDEWYNSFESFISHVGPRPSLEHTIDRFPNKYGNYEPGNVRWATRKQQNNNKIINIMIEYNGETKTLAEWCDKFEINYKSAHKRLHVKKWDIDKTIKRGIDNRNGVLYKSFPRKKLVNI